jgi:hypothetical protein
VLGGRWTRRTELVAAFGLPLAALLLYLDDSVECACWLVGVAMIASSAAQWSVTLCDQPDVNHRLAL